jgi:uncharacterized Zn finger protein
MATITHPTARSRELTRDKVLEAHVRRLVDSGTFARGSAYADGGAVLEHRWIEGDVRLLGAVKGSGRNSYVTSVTIARSVAGEVIDIGGSCSCPVAFNCKHVVALVLTAESGDHQTGRSGPR